MLTCAILLPMMLNATQTGFAIEDSGQKLTILEEDRPVLVYNYEMVEPPEGVEERYRRACYIHPLYGLDGQVLTEDFPEDHYHHRGVFWAWPGSSVGDRDLDTWHLTAKQVHQEILEQSANEDQAAVSARNVWVFPEEPDKPIIEEHVRFTVLPENADKRMIDFVLRFKNICDETVLIKGKGNTGYGGINIRPDEAFKPMHFMAPGGPFEDDQTAYESPWADVSVETSEGTMAGVAIFQHPENAEYPDQKWIMRHYSFLGASWPHVKPYVLKPGEELALRYRLVVHRGSAQDADVERAFYEYARAIDHVAQPFSAKLMDDSIRVYVNDELFTEYKFAADQKYPYLYPVAGPGSGLSVTTESSEPWPHHHSLFFGCDHVNGGNYWQGANEEGQILSQGAEIAEVTPEHVVIKDACLWKKPEEEPVMSDERLVTITSPEEGIRIIDFDITLTPLTDIRIDKTNHSLFCGRMRPGLSVEAGGTLVNAEGDTSEAGTFGKPSPWCDYFGTDNGVTEGMAILEHPNNRWYPAPWFTRDYGFFSPTPMYWPEGDATELAEGERLQLRYRVVVHAGDTEAAGIGEYFKTFKKW